MTTINITLSGYVPMFYEFIKLICFGLAIFKNKIWAKRVCVRAVCCVCMSWW